MLLPELVTPRSWIRPALRSWGSPSWQLAREGAWQPRTQDLSETRAQLERALACSVVVLRRRHESLVGPLLGLQRSEALRHLVLQEACSLSPGSPWEGEALEPVLLRGFEAELFLLERSHPGWTLRLPPALEELLKSR
ncbi:MAG: hypothetical protein H6741_16280 [Alphaproteobacteria bacterium]|nr:hypothetical protein [Alphaproteobacteria bacterium]MCB9794272.1 hypothetical protein [Alphaproteobacteria bacterium]